MVMMPEERAYVIEVGDEFFSEMEEQAQEKGLTEIVIVAPVLGGQILLHTKLFYPEGVYRLPSGRMKPGEGPDEALLREFREELGQQGEVDRKLGVVCVTIKHGERSEDFISHVYLVKELVHEPMPEDEEEQITDFKAVDASELPAIAEELRNLPGRWCDWGRLRAIPHDFVAETLV